MSNYHGGPISSGINFLLRVVRAFPAFVSTHLDSSRSYYSQISLVENDQARLAAGKQYFFIAKRATLTLANCVTRVMLSQSVNISRYNYI